MSVLTYAIVMVFVRFKEKILFIKRNSKRYTNKWQMVTGFPTEFESMEGAAAREVFEETGLKGKIVKAGKSFEYKDNIARYICVPYIMDVTSDKVILSKEHSDYCWIIPRDYATLDYLPNMKEDLESVGLI